MAFVNNTVLDKSLNYIATESTKVLVVDSTSEDYATVVSAKLGEATITNSAFSTKDDTSSAGGRTLTFTSPTIPITKDGTVQRVVLINETDTIITLIFDTQATRDAKNGDNVLPDPVSYSISKGL